MSLLTPVLDQLDSSFSESLERLFALLRIPSVSTEPAHAGDCRTAAEWLATALCEIGFDASLCATTGHPVVVGSHEGVKDRPHVLFYGHYDVQPVGPATLWSSPPFEPEIRKNAAGSAAIFGRGASDDKGQLMTILEALRAWKAVHGSLPCRVTVLLEGEEEVSSPSLDALLIAHRGELNADIAVICDTTMWNREVPAIWMSLRGLVCEEVSVTAATRDLHSGLYGGAAMNPLRALADVMSALHDAQGRVTLPNFYDGVEEVSPEILVQWRQLEAESPDFLATVGLSRLAGESGRTLFESIWARPTAEFNSVAGGNYGEGFKTVIPAKATLNLSFRLVVGQNPHAIREAFRNFVRKRLPADCVVAFTAHGAYPAFRLESDSGFLRAARSALADEWGTVPIMIGGGGSIAAAAAFQRLLAIDSLVIGFADETDNQHAPDEKYDLRSFRKGQRFWARFLANCAVDGQTSG